MSENEMSTENMNLQRKSSILKPQKTRKPLCDVVIGNEDSDDNTANANKASRRVSFASNNFVKPFVADPEKNTIWDLTYEEAIESSGSLQSIKSLHQNEQHMTILAGDELDLTNPVADNEIITSTNVGSKGQNTEIDMELTSPIIINNSNTGCIAEAHDFGNTKIDEVAMEFTVPITFKHGSTECVTRDNDFTKKNDEEDMEFTLPINFINADMERVLPVNDRTKENMDFTMAITKGNDVKTNITESSLSTMELIDPISFTNKTRNENSYLSMEQSCDDTEKLINYNLSGMKQSDFSKVITGDLIPSFSNLPTMPLRGINSTSFIQALTTEEKLESYVEGVGISDAIPDVIYTSPTRTLSSSDLNGSNKFDKEDGEINMEIYCDENMDVFIEETASASLAMNAKELSNKNISGIRENVDKQEFDVNELRENPELHKLNRSTQSQYPVDVQNDDNTFIELCTRLTTENTTLLCDTSAISIAESSQGEEHLSSGTTDEAAGISLDFNDLVPIDLTRTFSVMAEARKLHKLRNQRIQKLKAQVAQTVSFYNEQNEKYEKMRKALDDYDDWKKQRAETVSAKNTDLDFVGVGTQEPKVLTWQEKISQLCERNDGYWKIVSLDTNPYKFNTLYGSIELMVELNEDNGQVLRIDLENNLSEKSEPIALYVHKLFLEKLELKHIQAALGEKFEILSLLDYIRLTMEKLLVIQREYTLLSITSAVCMDRDFKITFDLISVKCVFSWSFTIDVSDHDAICSDVVTYYAKIGDLKEREIKKCMSDCPSGFAFVKAFVEALYNFLDRVEGKK